MFGDWKEMLCFHWSKNSRFLLFLSALALICCFFQNILVVSAADRILPENEELVIVIDPGHGGENLGTTENGFTEKKMTMITARAMYQELKKYDGVKVYLTREEDEDLSLKERAQFAENVDADFLFSIHFNASLSHQYFGAEVWIPAHTPFHAYAYQFAYTELSELRDMGLFIRGIKTRVDGEDEYYGIIRENLKLSVPAVIIEHCHVDQEKDASFCDTDEKLIALGKADARAVAKYFGLKSTSLGVDYGDYDKLPEVSKDSLVKLTLNSQTPPDVCQIELKEIDEENGVAKIELSAVDHDSVLVYYDYSIDGGKSYYPLREWPDTDVFEGTCEDTVSVSIQIPTGIKPKIIFRVYNLFDQATESNAITLTNVFYQNTEEDSKSIVAVEDAADNIIGGDFANDSVSPVFKPEKIEEIIETHKNDFIGIAENGFVILLVIFSMVLSVQLIRFIGRQNRRRRRRR